MRGMFPRVLGVSAVMVFPALADTGADGSRSVSAAIGTQMNVRAAAVGTHEGQVFLKLDGPLFENCLYGVLYTLLASGFAEYVMSIAQTARTTGTGVAQISYTKSGAGICTIDIIEL